MKVRNKRLLAVLAALVAVSMIATGCGGGGTTGGDRRYRGQDDQDRYRRSADRRRCRARQGMKRGADARHRAGQRVRGRQGRWHHVRGRRRRRPGRPQDRRYRRQHVRVRPEPRRRHGPPELGRLDPGLQGLQREQDRPGLAGLDQPGADPAGLQQRLPRLHDRRGSGPRWRRLRLQASASRPPSSSTTRPRTARVSRPSSPSSSQATAARFSSPRRPPTRTPTSTPSSPRSRPRTRTSSTTAASTTPARCWPSRPRTPASRLR